MARSVNNGVPTTYSYDYDGKNNRVKRVLGASTTHYVYADDGQLMGEYPAGSIATGKEYFYLGTQMIASIQPNQAPVANAGSAQNSTGGNVVTLNGSASSDPDGVIASYTWLQLSGTQVTLSNAQAASPTFTAPQVLGTRTLQFRLAVVDDDGAQSNSNVTITNTFTAPDTDANQDIAGDGITNLNEYLSGGSIRYCHFLQTLLEWGLMCSCRRHHDPRPNPARQNQLRENRTDVGAGRRLVL